MRHETIANLCAAGVMTAVICVLSPFSVPIGPVPVAFANLAIYLAVYLLGWQWGTASCLAYLLVGLAGLPVFSGFGSGAGQLLGPTGGYLLGYLPMALVGGWILNHARSKWMHGLGLVLGTALCYLLGTAWFCWQGGYAVGAALGLCVIPFVPFDLCKIVLAIGLGSVLRRRLQQAGLLEKKRVAP